MMSVFINLFIRQLIAHSLADFIFQGNSFAKIKDVNGFKSWQLYVHGVFVMLFSLLLAANISFLKFALIIGLSHIFIDGLKNKLIIWIDQLIKIPRCRIFWIRNLLTDTRKLIHKTVSNPGSILFIDQALHILIIYFVIHFYLGTQLSLKSFYYNLNELLKENTLLIYFLGYLICLKPSNIIIKTLVIKWITNSTRDSHQFNVSESLVDAGKLIGNIERVLTLTLILLSQYTALGFLIAAKSILRFKDTEPKKSEYMLIGTLLSFGIAITTGVLIKLVVPYFAK